MSLIVCDCAPQPETMDSDHPAFAESAMHTLEHAMYDLDLFGSDDDADVGDEQPLFDSLLAVSEASSADADADGELDSGDEDMNKGSNADVEDDATQMETYNGNMRLEKRSHSDFLQADAAAINAELDAQIERNGNVEDVRNTAAWQSSSEPREQQASTSDAAHVGPKRPKTKKGANANAVLHRQRFHSGASALATSDDGAFIAWFDEHMSRLIVMDCVAKATALFRALPGEVRAAYARRERRRRPSRRDNTVLSKYQRY